MTLSTWLTFFAASWAISFSPGAGAISAMSTALRVGFGRAAWNTLGLIAGIMVQFVVVGIGLGALLATSETAFTVVKAAGVGYLIYLGIRQCRARTLPIAVSTTTSHEPIRKMMLRAMLINASNPKGTVFLLAVVPQFVNPTAALAPQYAAIAATLALTDLVAMSFYSLLAAKVLRLLRNPRHIRWMNRFFGALFILAGAFLATFRRMP
jgi:homoserine/homoserine lactone efflux protein